MVKENKKTQVVSISLLHQQSVFILYWFAFNEILAFVLSPHSVVGPVVFFSRCYYGYNKVKIKNDSTLKLSLY